MKKEWTPEYDEMYWIVDTKNNPAVAQVKWVGCRYGHNQYCNGNYFKTRKEALAAAEKVKALLLSLHKEQPVTECNQLPKLTAEVFDRPDCPKSALWATVDEDGTAYFHLFAPMLYADEWQHTNCCKKIPGKWDATNWTKIIQRPEKKTLPKWCKQGEWIYTSSEQYLKIEGISIDLQKIELSNGVVWSNQDIIEEAVPARLRPYNAGEMKALMGKVIAKGPSMHIVTGFENVFDNECMVHVNGCLYGANDLLRQFTINNKPAGVLEHLENGEWVQ